MPLQANTIALSILISLHYIIFYNVGYANKTPD